MLGNCICSIEIAKKMPCKWNCKITNSPQDHRDSKAQLTACVQQFFSMKTTNLQSQFHPIKAAINWAAKHFDVPTVSQVQHEPISSTFLCAGLYTSDLMLDVTVSSKGWQCQRKSQWEATWMRVLPLLCKHIPLKARELQGRGRILCWAGESVMQKGEDKHKHTHPHKTLQQFCQIWKCTHKKRRGYEFDD